MAIIKIIFGIAYDNWILQLKFLFHLELFESSVDKWHGEVFIAIAPVKNLFSFRKYMENILSL